MVEIRSADDNNDKPPPEIYVIMSGGGVSLPQLHDTQTQISKSTARFHTQVDIARTQLGVRAHEHIIGLSEANFQQQTIVNGIPFHRNTRFQSRETVLEDLHKRLHPRGATAKGLFPGQTSCVIRGIGGVGKTQVALEYTYRYREDYKFIFWVKAETNVQISTSFASFARSLLPTRVVQDQLANVKLMRDWLVQNERWLIVFDNADDTSVDLSLFWPPCAHGSIVITTQRRTFSHWAATDIHLDAFDAEEGGRLILEMVKEPGGGHSTETFKEARDISIELGGLPILLSHVAGYIDGTKASLAEILQNLRQPAGFKQVWGFDSTTSTNFQYGEPMAKIWHLALGSLKPEALLVFQIMAMLSPDDVYEDMLFGDWDDPELAFLSDEKRFEQVDYLPGYRARADSETRFNDTRQSLIDRHLVGIVREGAKATLSIHRVLKKYLLQRLEDDGEGTLTKVFRRATAIVRQVFPKADELQTPSMDTAVECEKYLPHILSLMTIYQDWSPEIKSTFEFATLLSDIGTNYMWERGLSNDAIAVLRLGERVCNELRQLPSINTVHADICSIAASVYETIGLSGRRKALEASEKSLKLREEQIQMLEKSGKPITTTVSLQLANAKNDIGCVLLAYGDAKAALPYFLESHELKKLHAKENELPWHFGETYKNLALTKLYQGDKTGADADARRSCDLCCHGRGEMDAATLKARSFLGIVCMNIGKENEALQLHKEVYRTRKKLFGPLNLHTKNSLFLVAELYRLKGKMAKAESHFRLVLSQTEFCWSEEPIARAKYHLALVIQHTPECLSTERQKEADLLLREARAIRKKIISETMSESDGTMDQELQQFDYMNCIYNFRLLVVPNAVTLATFTRNRIGAAECAELHMEAETSRSGVGA